MTREAPLAIRISELEEGPLPPGRVLVVDDEPAVRKTVVRTLERMGHRCETASSVMEARSRLETGEFDAVLTDLRMPGESGLELVRYVKEAVPDVQVLVMTAYADVATAIEALRLNADDYLIKPFDLQELVHGVDRALRHRRLVLENRAYRERLEERVLEQARRIEKLFFSSIRSLIQALEARDPHTRGHSERVTRYAVTLAQELGDAALDRLSLGAQLHDIGKIGTREVILSKPDRLTPEEMEHIREHPLVGVRILQPVVDEGDILAVVRSHHERWDGKGYPDGLAGEGIPWYARIVAVADTLDAITSSRAYRPARSWEEALAEIRRCSGTQFDPEVAEVALSALRSPPDATGR